MSLGNAEMYKYGRNRSPDLRVDPLGGSSKRACFYQACTKYEKRFKCRPPKNRAPTPQESSTCTSLMLWHQINIIAPKVICTLGASATQGLLGADIKIGDARGTFQELDGIKIMPTYHPAYLLGFIFI